MRERPEYADIEVSMCNICGKAPSFEIEDWVTHKFKFIDARLLHFCGDITIDIKGHAGFKPKTENLDYVAKECILKWNKLNSINGE